MMAGNYLIPQACSLHSGFCLTKSVTVIVSCKKNKWKFWKRQGIGSMVTGLYFSGNRRGTSWKSLLTYELACLLRRDAILNPGSHPPSRGATGFKMDMLRKVF